MSANEPEEREDVFELPVGSPTKDHRTGSTEVDIDGENLNFFNHYPLPRNGNRVFSAAFIV